jgi:hypothetical protein
MHGKRNTFGKRAMISLVADVEAVNDAKDPKPEFLEPIC